VGNIVLGTEKFNVAVTQQIHSHASCRRNSSH